jgi:hypothetical protein
VSNLATLPKPDRIDGELARVQANLTILTNLLGYTREPLNTKPTPCPFFVPRGQKGFL